jgi:hypothetical protein
MYELGTAPVQALVCRGIHPAFFFAPAHPEFSSINIFKAFGNDQGNSKKGGWWNGQ